jgi:uncharacterized protein (TIGR02147 family)
LSQDKNKEISVFNYDDYRKFLREFYDAEKSRSSKFSFRFFSRVAGFSSPSALKRVMDGERNLSLESVRKFIKALRLNKEEAQFFQNLVLLNQSATTEDRSFFAEQLLSSQSYRRIHPLHLSQFNYFNHWYYVVIREMVALPGFQDDPQWIARTIRPRISVADADRALKELEAMGLVARDGAGRLRQAEMAVTANGVTAPSLVAFHKQMILKAADAIDSIPRERREISSMTSPVSEEGLKMIKELLEKFRKDIVAVLNRDQAPGQVMQFNFHLFPLTGDGGTGHE